MLSLFAGVDFIVEPGYFLAALALGAAGLAAVLTFVAALAARAGGSGMLMAVLSFPLIIPLLYLLVNAGAHGVGLLSGGGEDLLLLLAGVDLLAGAAGMVLFPFVWRD